MSRCFSCHLVYCVCQEGIHIGHARAIKIQLLRGQVGHFLPSCKVLNKCKADNACDIPEVRSVHHLLEHAVHSVYAADATVFSAHRGPVRAAAAAAATPANALFELTHRIASSLVFTTFSTILHFRCQQILLLQPVSPQ